MDAESVYFLKRANIDPTPLKLIGYVHRKRPLKRFLRWYLAVGWKKYESIALSEDKDYTDRRKFRSLGDIFRICYNYYPGTTFAEVRRHVLKLDITGHTCPHIGRRIFVLARAKPFWLPLDIGSHDEFGFKVYYYNKKGKKLKGKLDAIGQL